jgi:hypothetical protein
MSRGEGDVGAGRRRRAKGVKAFLDENSFAFVIAGLDPAIHLFERNPQSIFLQRRWMPATSAGMTE